MRADASPCATSHCFERPVRVRRPFRFGAVDGHAAPQAFVRVEIEVEGRARRVGASAELMVPNGSTSGRSCRPAQTSTTCGARWRSRATLYLARSGFETAFGLHAALIGAQVAACAQRTFRRWRRLTARPKSTRRCSTRCCARCDVNFFDGMAGESRRDRCAADAAICDDADIATFLAARAPPLERGRGAAYRRPRRRRSRATRRRRRRPPTNAGARYFKLKLGGDPSSRCRAPDRGSARSSSTLAQTTASRSTATSNMPISRRLRALVERLDRDRALAPIAAKPALYRAADAARHHAGRSPLGALARRDFIIDEADDSLRRVPGGARARLSRRLHRNPARALQVDPQRDARAPKWSARRRQRSSSPART